MTAADFVNAVRCHLRRAAGRPNRIDADGTILAEQRRGHETAWPTPIRADPTTRRCRRCDQQLVAIDVIETYVQIVRQRCSAIVDGDAADARLQSGRQAIRKPPTRVLVEHLLRRSRMPSLVDDAERRACGRPPLLTAADDERLELSAFLRTTIAPHFQAVILCPSVTAIGTSSRRRSEPCRRLAPHRRGDRAARRDRADLGATGSPSHCSP
jgi:hypothetical protein